jgi:hypothetical protein
MKAISLLNPWAWAVVMGLKDIENRKWSTKFRGEILIHASKGYDPIGEIVLRENGVEPPPRDSLDYGALIGKVTITDCVKFSASKWFFGPWGFTLKDTVRFERPTPCKGQLGFFMVREDIYEPERT